MTILTIFIRHQMVQNQYSQTASRLKQITFFQERNVTLA